MKNFDNLYFEIKPKDNLIIGPPKELETNWRNISGMIYLPEEKLYDLSWAGYENNGFIKVSKENSKVIQSFKSKIDVIEIIKSLCRDIISKNRYEMECGIINVNFEYSLQLTDRSKLLLSMKYLECLEGEDFEFYWKTVSGHKKFKSKEFKKLYKNIQKYIQKLYDEEKKILEEINLCKDIFSLLNISLELNTSNEITI